MFKHILIAVDGSPLSEKALDYALQLAKESDARLSAITIVVPFPVTLYEPGFSMSPQRYIEDANLSADGILDRAAAVGRRAGVNVMPLKTENEHIYLAIIDAAAKQGCDLIVMASHGRRGIAAVVLGSETIKVLTHATIPVLVYRQAG